MPDWKDVQPYLDKIGLAIADIAKGLGVAAEHVMYVLVKQQFAYGIVATLGSLIYLGLFAWLFVYVQKHNKWMVGEGLVIAAIAITGIGAFLVFLFGLCDGIMHLLNPEYYAMQDIFDFLKSLHNK